MMLDVAETLDPLLSARAKRIEEGELDLDEDEDAAETTLQLIFFDGEEAFVSWTDTDSIYGAKLVHLSLYPSRHIPSLSLNRHLAEKWGTTYLPPHPKRRLISAATPTTPLSTIEHLVLVDLLGAAHPRVRSYYPDTAWLFDALVRAETRLRDAGILDPAVLGVRSFFHPRGAGDVSLGYMGDDHLPFLHRGVSVLHIIAEPFPRVWHTLGVSIYLLFYMLHMSYTQAQPTPCVFLIACFSSSVADMVYDVVHRTTRQRSISRRCAHGTSSFACSSQSISGCVPTFYGAQNRPLRHTPLRQ